MQPNKHSTPTSEKFPISAQETLTYFHALKRTNTYLESLSDASEEYDPRSSRTLGGAALSATAAKIAEQETPEAKQFNKEYASLLGAIPGYMSVVEKSTRNELLTAQEKRQVIPLNHALKEIIDSHQSMTRIELLEMVSRAILMTGYSDAGDAIRDINQKIIPGMEHELAGAANLYNLPDFPLVQDTTVEDELQGVDARLTYDDGVEITIDFKKSQEAADRAQARHDNYRNKHGITAPDTHLILWTGYETTDFIPNKIGRVTTEALQREQYHINYYVNQCRQEIRRHSDSLLTK